MLFGLITGKSRNLKPPMTTEEKVASAASYLAKHSAEQRRKARSTRIAEHIAAMKASPVSPIAPREVVVAGVGRTRA